MIAPQSGPTTCRVDVLVSGHLVLPDVPVTAGTVTVNRANLTRRSLSLTLPSRYDDGSRLVDLTPRGVVGDLLTPFGSELRVWGKVNDVMAPLGVFGVRSMDATYPDGALSITGIDRFKAVSEFRFPFPKTVFSGSALGFLQTFVGAPVSIDPAVTDAAVPDQTFDRDRDTAIGQLAASLGAEVFCDADGGFVVQPIPDPQGVAERQFTGGDVLTDLTRTLSRDGVYNGIVATGQSTGSTPAPTSSLIIDDDPTSPTFWGGPFGRVTGFYASSLLTTVEQANVAAAGQLRNKLGAARSVTFSMVPDFTLREGEVVGVTVVDNNHSYYEQHIIDGLTFDLSGLTAVKATTRAAQTVSTGVS